MKRNRHVVFITISILVLRGWNLNQPSFGHPSFQYKIVTEIWSNSKVKICIHLFNNNNNNNNNKSHKVCFSATKAYAPECKSSESVMQVQCNVQGVQWVHCLREKCRNGLSSYQLLSQSVKTCHGVICYIHQHAEAESARLGLPLAQVYSWLNKNNIVV